jgi:hypothetical protein
VAEVAGAKGDDPLAGRTVPSHECVAEWPSRTVIRAASAASGARMRFDVGLGGAVAGAASPKGGGPAGEEAVGAADREQARDGSSSWSLVKAASVSGATGPYCFGAQGPGCWCRLAVNGLDRVAARPSAPRDRDIEAFFGGAF